MRVIVASQNPVKIKAVQDAYATFLPDLPVETVGVQVASGVADQPMSDDETLQGAWQRASNAQEAYPGADAWVGIEGGVAPLGDELLVIAWVVVHAVHPEYPERFITGKARSGAFVLPPQVARLIGEGKELGDANDIVFSQTNSKQKNGALGLLTDNHIQRADYYTHTLIMALIPYVQHRLFT